MTASPNLLPCPLCGCPIKHGMTKRGRCQLHGEPIQNYRVWCEKCGMTVEYGSYELAKRFWNKRAPDPEREAMAKVCEAAQARMDTYDKGEDYTGGIRSVEWSNLRDALADLERARKGEG